MSTPAHPASNGAWMLNRLALGGFMLLAARASKARAKCAARTERRVRCLTGRCSAPLADRRNKKRVAGRTRSSFASHPSCDVRPQRSI